VVTSALPGPFWLLEAKKSGGEKEAKKRTRPFFRLLAFFPLRHTLLPCQQQSNNCPEAKSCNREGRRENAVAKHPFRPEVFQSVASSSVDSKTEYNYVHLSAKPCRWTAFESD
jgi:hypothetical protein